MDPRPVVFDLDLTLIQSSVHRSWLRVLTDRGLDDAAAERAYLAGVGFATIETARAAFPTLARGAELAIVGEFNEIVLAAGSEEVEGASETLQALSRAGHRLFLSTGADPDTLRAALRRHNWEDVFTLALGSTLALPKGVEHLQRFAFSDDKTLAIWGSDALTVGDGRGEMQFGVAAGLPYRCAYVPDSHPQHIELLHRAGANLRVTALTELVELASATDPIHAARWSI